MVDEKEQKRQDELEKRQDDLEKLATKDDLNKLASKSDLSDLRRKALEDERAVMRVRMSCL